MIAVNATDFQNNFDKYLLLVQTGEEVIILRNGKEVARMISHDRSVLFLTDSLVGVLKNDYNDKVEKVERMSRYESVDWY